MRPRLLLALVPAFPARGHALCGFYPWRRAEVAGSPAGRAPHWKTPTYTSGVSPAAPIIPETEYTWPPRIGTW